MKNTPTARSGVRAIRAGGVLGLVLVATAAAAPAAAQHSALLLDALAADLSLRVPAAPAVSLFDADFARAQLQYTRVARARVDARFNFRKLFHDRGIAYPAAEVFLRVFKQERVLELWVRPEGTASFALLREYPVCAVSGELGPKRVRGDRQVPEGFYEIDWFNPHSDYYLSLHVSYPNQADRGRGARGNLGGDIFIHGGCESIGCIAITDDGIKELYWAGVEARAAGQRSIPVHIFPARLTDAGFTRLAEAHGDQPELTRFWASLKPGFDHFERTRRLPSVVAAAGGLYRMTGVADAPAPSGGPVRTP